MSNLNFYYGTLNALKQVALEVPERQVTALIEPSGCGKSTLLRVLNRLYDLYPDQRATGDVYLDGEDILAEKLDLNWLRCRIGMVFQAGAPFPMSIFNNIAMGAQLLEHLSPAQTRERVEELLRCASLWSEVKDRLFEPAASLSIGRQQRLCIARAISTRPEVLLLDEPTGALEPISMKEIEDLVAELKKTITIMIVTHMEQAARCADQVAFFYLGEIIEVGSATQIFRSAKHPRTQAFIAGKFGREWLNRMRWAITSKRRRE